MIVHAMETLSLGLLLSNLFERGSSVLEVLSTYQPSGAILVYSLISKFFLVSSAFDTSIWSFIKRSAVTRRSRCFRQHAHG